MLLISISAGLILNQQVLQALSLCIVLVIMIFPILFYPLAILWFGLSKIMGMITSRILLGIIFYLVVTPVGLARRLYGKDRLNLVNFKKGENSVFINRDHKYDASDMTHLY